jgi:TolB protein
MLIRHANWKRLRGLQFHRRGLASLVAIMLAHVSLPAYGESELWIIGADGQGFRRFADTPGYRCGSPDWSPDGKSVAYDTWPIGGSSGDSQVAIVHGDGGNARLLGPGAMPSWSPDGTHLVCHTYGAEGIVVMNANGSGRESIVNHWGSPRWCPRGNRIASITETRDAIAIFDCATGIERTIFRGPYSLRQGFGISPDGLRFCFGGNGGGVGLATLNERTMRANVRWLTKSGQCYHASWAPDGRRVVYGWARTENDLDQLYIMDVDSNDEPAWLTGQDRKRTNTNPDWSPDGKTIIFVSQSPKKPVANAP